MLVVFNTIRAFFCCVEKRRHDGIDQPLKHSKKSSFDYNNYGLYAGDDFLLHWLTIT